MGHIHELFDFTTSAFIVYEGRILLQLHTKIGKWLQPGGHIELDEDPMQALYREIEEETGLTKSDLKIVELAQDKRTHSDTNRTLPIPFDINVHNFNESHQHIDLCYLMIANTNKVRLEEDKATDISWFTLEEIESFVDRELAFVDTLELATLALRNS